MKRVLIWISAFIILSATATRAEVLTSQPAVEAEVKGVFNLILYGGRHLDDLETVAVLDISGDGYDFAVNAPKFDYKIINGVSAGDSLLRAFEFVKGHPKAVKKELRKIVRGGVILGFEVRPLYEPFAYGAHDVLDVTYTLRGNKVRMTVRLIPEVERMLRDGDLLRIRK